MSFIDTTLGSPVEYLRSRTGEPATRITSPVTASDPTIATGLDYFRSVLALWGLNIPSLISWANERLLAGESIDKILFDLEQRPEFDAAFPEIKARRDRALASGIQLAPIGPGEILEYRTQAKSLMRSYGLPESFYASNANFTDLIVGDVSMAELDDRLQLASRRVANAPFEVRSAFEDLLGFAGEQALFMLFTDVDRALPELEDLVQAAEAGGAARRFGFGLSRAEQELMAGYNIEYDRALEGFGNLDVQRGLFEETLYEEDFTVGQEGIAAEFGVGAGAKERLARRGEARRAETGGSAGGLVEQRGATGLGVAGRR